jgi:hypothetical protein
MRKGGAADLAAAAGLKNADGEDGDLLLLLLLMLLLLLPMTTIQRQVTKVKAARSLLDGPSQRWRRARRTKRRKREAALLMMVLPVDAGEVRLVRHAVGLTWEPTEERGSPKAWCLVSLLLLLMMMMSGGAL